ncbi:MAG: acyl carrier protein [Polyangiaceae bacterium]|nr:acyl carrier protein [Polyangiaceae bacterium]
MRLEDIQAALGTYLAREVLFRDTPLEPDADLYDVGFDSLSLSRVLVFVEERFGVHIPDEEVDVDAVTTLAQMSRFVASYVERRAATP